MPRFDREIHKFILTCERPDHRTALETTLDKCTRVFGMALKSSTVHASLRQPNPSKEELDGAVRMAEFHSHRLGLTLSHIRMLMVSSWQNVGMFRENPHVKGARPTTLPTLSKGLQAKINRNRRKASG
jgi:hypothetical protein